ncbi:MAG: L-2-amino-thiazoline-4-carboxylic acid hydrolase [Gammaproteobacteria bacterium]|nr:L-2-amino-thiazoline-4-carboxylic acid hydrolase [Gammaproteobacteria bacterium]
MITSSITVQYPWNRIAFYAEYGFLRLLKRKLDLKNLTDSKLVSASIAEAAVCIFSENGLSVRDSAGQFHLLLASYVLGAMSVLSRIMDNEEAYEMVKYCVKENGARWVKYSFAVGLWLARGKFAYIVKNCGYGVKQEFGMGFEIEVETDNARYLNTIVHRCAFHELFSKYDSPHLTQLMCEWDNNWADLLKGNRHLSFERPLTIADGNSRCEFRYRARA